MASIKISLEFIAVNTGLLKMIVGVLTTWPPRSPDATPCDSFLWGYVKDQVNPLNPELNPICYLLALLGAHHFLHASRIRVKLLTFRLLMSYIYIWSTHS